MRKTNVNLHMERSRILLTIVAFSLISLFLNFFLMKSSDSAFAQLNSLWRSDYNYSATMKNPIGRDDYYRINAGIYFSLSANAETSLNAEIVMQALKSEYSKQVYWNAEKLSTYGVAISEGIAKANSLKSGDKLYSKRIVDDKVCEYTIEQIFPEVSSVRVSEHKNYSSGIIVMGYDRLYIENISHTVLIFTNEPVNELFENFSDMPTDIIYRDDEIAFVSKTLMPYIVTFAVLSVLCTIGLVLFLTKQLSYNFSRLVVLGFQKKQLDAAYIRNVIGIGFLSVLLVSCTTLMAGSKVGIYFNEVFFLLVISFIELATLIITSTLSLRRLWRK